MDNIAGPVDADKLETCLWMLRANLDNAELEPLIAALETLKQAPGDPALLARVETAFNELDILQGAVLTYAPYMSVLLSVNPFGND
jgi:hypothetical protein